MTVRVHGGVITDQTLTGSLRYFEIDGGTNEFVNTIADSNFRAAYASVAAGGATYAVLDVLTTTGGTGTEPTFTVTVVDGTAVASVQVTTAGDLTALATNPLTTTVAPANGSGATLDVTYSSTIIVPGASGTTADGSELFVPANAPVPNSAAEQVLAVVAERANIVQIAIVSDDLIQVAVENTGFGWVVSDDDMRDAIRALGAAVVVPDTTNTGTTVDLTLATVTEKFFSAGIA